MKNWYRYHLYDKDGLRQASTDCYSTAIGMARNNNFELRQSLPMIRVGKHKILRFKVLRKITNQTELFV